MLRLSSVLPDFLFLYIVVWIYLEDRVISYSHKELRRWDIKIANARIHSNITFFTYFLHHLVTISK